MTDRQTDDISRLGPISDAIQKLAEEKRKEPFGTSQAGMTEYNRPHQAKLTQKVVREYIRHLGGTFGRDGYGDLIVRFGEEVYHTNDLLDALGTARCMKGGHPNIEQAEEYLTSQGVTK